MKINNTQRQIELDEGEIAIVTLPYQTADGKTRARTCGIRFLRERGMQQLSESELHYCVHELNTGIDHQETYSINHDPDDGSIKAFVYVRPRPDCFDSDCGTVAIIVPKFTAEFKDRADDAYASRFGLDQAVLSSITDQEELVDAESARYQLLSQDYQMAAEILGVRPELIGVKLDTDTDAAAVWVWRETGVDLSHLPKQDQWKDGVQRLMLGPGITLNSPEHPDWEGGFTIIPLQMTSTESAEAEPINADEAGIGIGVTGTNPANAKDSIPADMKAIVQKALDAGQFVYAALPLPIRSKILVLLPAPDDQGRVITAVEIGVGEFSEQEPDQILRQFYQRDLRSVELFEAIYDLIDNGRPHAAKCDCSQCEAWSRIKVWAVTSDTPDI